MPPSTMSPSTTPSTSEASTVRERASLLRDQLHRLRRLKSEASSSLDDIVSRADALDSFLSPLKDKTDELSLGLANVEKALRVTTEALSHFATYRDLQNTIDRGLSAPTSASEEAAVLEYAKAMERLRVSSDFLERHFAGSGGAAASPELTHTRGALLTALTHCEVDFANRLLRASSNDEREGGHDVRILRILAATILSHEGPSGAAVRNAYADIRFERLKQHVSESMRAGGSDQGVENAERMLRRLESRDDKSKADQAATTGQGGPAVDVWLSMVSAIALHLEAERDFAYGIFSEDRADAAFASAVSGLFVLLLTVARAVASGPHSPEKVFALLDMLQRLDGQDLGAKLKSVHIQRTRGGSIGVRSPNHRSRVLEGLEGLLRKLEETKGVLMKAAQTTFTEFAKALEKEDGVLSIAIHGGHRKRGGKGGHAKALGARDHAAGIPRNATVHPLTAYTIHYIRRLYGYDSAPRYLLNQRRGTGRDAMGEMFCSILGSLGKALRRKVQSSASVDGSKIFYSHNASKASSYIEDAHRRSFGDVFMMNNLNYIVGSIAKSKFGHLLNDGPFVSEQKQQIQRYMSSYIHSSWKLPREWLDLVYHRLNDLARLGAGAEELEAIEADKKLKGFLRQFHAAWKALVQDQSAWAIPDDALKAALCGKVAKDFLPSYGRCAAVLAELSATPSIAAMTKYIPTDARRVIETSLFTNSA